MDSKNIIVRMPNWIGDLVMATPVLTDLRNAFPRSSITAMCKEPLATLLAEDEALDELFSFTRPSNDFDRRQENRNVIEKIRSGKYDLGILLTNSFSSAWCFWQAGVKRRVGYKAHFRSFFLNGGVAIPKEPMHQVDLYKGLLESIGIPRSATAPRLFLTQREKERAKTLLEQRGYRLGQRLVGINPGAAYGSAKCWLPERFRELTLKLVSQEGACVVFFGDTATMGLTKQICHGLPAAVINLAGTTTLRELACMIGACDLLITNDSGPMHIGSALGIPLIALFGSTDERLTGPWGQKEGIINKRSSCSPCFKRVCPIDFRCMKEIGVDEVLSLAVETLKKGNRV